MPMTRLTAITAAAVFLTGCNSSAPTHTTVPAHTHYRIFIDESDSVHEKQKGLWAHEALRLAGQLRYGDAIEISLIHARTADAAPLYPDQEIPIFDEDAPRSEQETAKRELHRVRREVKQALAEAIHPSTKVRITQTDVFGVFDRFRPDPVRRNLVLIFSDGLESADSRLNLERICLTQTNPPILLRQLAERRHWTNRSLGGCKHLFHSSGR